MSELNQLLRDIEKAESSSLARKDWHPGHSGAIDIRIASDGTWYHEGRAFQRESLIRLFASVLRKQDDEYFLLTPAEKLSIRVDDAPFVATMLEIINEDGQQALVFTTNLGEKIVVDSEHPIRIEVNEKNREPRPYIHFRDGLEALISRGAFFDLVNLAEEQERDGKLYLIINSLGHEFDLGCTDSLETT